MEYGLNKEIGIEKNENFPKKYLLIYKLYFKWNIFFT